MIRVSVRQADGQQRNHEFTDSQLTYAMGMARVWRLNGGAVSVTHELAADPVAALDGAA